MENKYKEGEAVRTNIGPKQNLTVGGYANRIYYCKIQVDPAKKELLCFDPELIVNKITDIGLLTSLNVKINK